MTQKMPKISLPTDLAMNYDSIDPLDGRYFDAEVAQYGSEKSRINYQAYVEAALAQTLAEFGICTSNVADQITKSAMNINIEDVYAEEKTTKHDIKALVNCIKRNIDDDAKPFVHFGATSYDIIATASALQLRDLTQQVVLPRLNKLVQTLVAISETHANTIQVGRTHGQHAVPVTFGFAISEYVQRIGASAEAIQALSEELYGKFSGAVGAYNALSIFIDEPLKFEKSVLSRVGLSPAPYSTQIVPAEQAIRLIDEMAIMAGVMANLSHDMRHLQRTEIAEIQERFEKGQTGSSTMAHKRNPWNFENVVSMSKQVLSQALNANMNISSEHQRDLTDSASSRFYVTVPAMVASMASRLDRIMSKLEVNEDAMQRNLQLSAGAIAAEPLYLLFEKHGHVAAHEKSKEISHAALAEKISLAKAVQNDNEGKIYWAKFSEREKQIVSEPEKYYVGLAAEKTFLIIKRWKK